MFAFCKFKDKDDHFVLYDKKDLKEIVEQMNMEIEKEISFEEFEKDFALYPMLDVDDLIIRTVNHKARTATHILDELGISCLATLKKEYVKIQEKSSRLSKSQRDLVEKQYKYLQTC